MRAICFSTKCESPDRRAITAIKEFMVLVRSAQFPYHMPILRGTRAFVVSPSH